MSPDCSSATPMLNRASVASRVSPLSRSVARGSSARSRRALSVSPNSVDSSDRLCRRRASQSVVVPSGRARAARRRTRRTPRGAPGAVQHEGADRADPAARTPRRTDSAWSVAASAARYRPRSSRTNARVMRASAATSTAPALVCDETARADSAFGLRRVRPNAAQRSPAARCASDDRADVVRRPAAGAGAATTRRLPRALRSGSRPTRSSACLARPSHSGTAATRGSRTS